MKEKVERKDIKYNFLKKIIIRADYNGVLERELEKTIEIIKPILKRYGFDRFDEGVINEVDFKIKDPEEIETQRMIPIGELNKTRTFIFLNSKDRKQIQINKYFMSLSVDYTKYIQFEEICRLFEELFKEINENNNYIRFLRLGLRKINNCILLDINRLNEIIKERYFATLGDLFDEENKISILEKQNIDAFVYNEININLVRYISSGLLNLNGKEQEAFQLVLDIDAYKNDEEYLNKITNSGNIYDELIKYNKVLFDTYIGMLEEKMISQLVNGNIDESLVLGVEKND